jgi:hypothetical protein
MPMDAVDALKRTGPGGVRRRQTPILVEGG